MNKECCDGLMISRTTEATIGKSGETRQLPIGPSSGYSLIWFSANANASSPSGIRPTKNMLQRLWPRMTPVISSLLQTVFSSNLTESSRDVLCFKSARALPSAEICMPGEPIELHRQAPHGRHHPQKTERLSDTKHYLLLLESCHQAHDQQRSPPSMELAQELSCSPTENLLELSQMIHHISGACEMIADDLSESSMRCKAYTRSPSCFSVPREDSSRFIIDGIFLELWKQAKIRS
nr:hypothetical protein Iba_chr15eCG6910 [Ipomoea batatas]